MNLNTTLKVFSTLLFFIAFIQGLNAQQDTIFKTNGEKVACKLLEIGTQAISFKKASNIDGPTFTENLGNVLYIKLKNGQIEEFTKAVKTTTASPTEMTTATTTASGNNNNGVGNEYKIIREGKNYFVNGQKITPKNVDRLLSKSNNPAVLIPYKTAKTTKTIQKIIKITSFPSTIGGIIGCVSTFGKVIDQSRGPGGITTNAWLTAGSTFIGTISLPITSKILKKKTNKLYDKTIDIYNVGKK